MRYDIFVGYRSIQTPGHLRPPNQTPGQLRPLQLRPPNSDPSIQTPLGSELFKNVYVTQNRQYGSARYIYIYIYI